jgi:L-2-hydroxyglutarate oxidase LhgO
MKFGLKQKTCGFMNNIVVVGGGASGWLTALYLKSVYQNKNITVIESSDNIRSRRRSNSAPYIFTRFFKYTSLRISIKM